MRPGVARGYAHASRELVTTGVTDVLTGVAHQIHPGDRAPLAYLPGLDDAVGHVGVGLGECLWHASVVRTEDDHAAVGGIRVWSRQSKMTLFDCLADDRAVTRTMLATSLEVVIHELIKHYEFLHASEVARPAPRNQCESMMISSRQLLRRQKGVFVDQTMLEFAYTTRAAG